MSQTTIPGDLLSSGPLGQLIEMGGPVMVVLVVMALVGLVTFVYLMLFGALYAPRYTRGLRQSLQDWKQTSDRSIYNRLRARSRGIKGLNPLNQLVMMTMAGRLRDEPADQIRESVSQKAQQALTPFEAPLKIIEVIAALAPLLGLLGTVLGMMEAFSTMAAAEGRASASQLSGGIYQALTTTAAGLVVAIPFAALAAWIEFRLRRLQGTLNSVLVEILSGSLPDNISTDPATDSLNEPALGESQGDAPGASHRQSTAQPATQEVDWQGHQTAANAVR